MADLDVAGSSGTAVVESRADRVRVALERIACGLPVRQALREFDLDTKSFYIELRDDPELRAQYEAARANAADALFDSLRDEIDNVGTVAVDSAGELVCDERGVPLRVLTSEAVQLARLRVDTLKWALGRMHPAKFSDKIQAELTGPGGGPVPLSIRVEYVGPAADDSDPKSVRVPTPAAS